MKQALCALIAVLMAAGVLAASASAATESQIISYAANGSAYSANQKMNPVASANGAYCNATRWTSGSFAGDGTGVGWWVRINWFDDVLRWRGNVHVRQAPDGSLYIPLAGVVFVDLAWIGTPHYCYF